MYVDVVEIKIKKLDYFTPLYYVLIKFFFYLFQKKN